MKLSRSKLKLKKQAETSNSSKIYTIVKAKYCSYIALLLKQKPTLIEVSAFGASNNILISGASGNREGSHKALAKQEKVHGVDHEMHLSIALSP